MKTIITKVFTVALILSYNLINAQQGVSSGSVSLLRNNGFNSYDQNGFLNQRSVIIEDFMNYHKHQILIPSKEDLAISIDYNNEILQNQNEFILQVGLATRDINDKIENRVNVSLVIDRSGSMSGSKIERVKSAMKKYVEGLHSGDFLSIIAFDSNAEVVLAATRIDTDKSIIYELIDKIYVGGSTNINDGMMLGYKEALKNHSNSINSRVVLLTDGMTNCGETNIENIINNSKQYNEKGIDISTIGVGQQLDFDLLRQLSEAGHGSNHFIGDNEEDIQKVFIEELKSLLYQIGKKPKVTIQLPKDYEIIESYGYSTLFISKNEISINIENLNSSITQILLMKVKKLHNNKKNIDVTVEYSRNSKNIILSETENYSSDVKNTNQEIKKNYQIALMATNLKKAAVEYGNQNLGNCKALIKNTIDYIELNSDLKDKDLNRLYQIIKKYDPKSFQYAVSKY